MIFLPLIKHLLPLESVNDLFLYKSPETPNNKVYTIRPYLHPDEVSSLFLLFVFIISHLELITCNFNP